MSGVWIKFFKDGSQEVGLDADIEANEASWSKGRLASIVRVQISNSNSTCCLSWPDTDWHQFDRYVVAIADGKQTGTRVARVLQARIKEEHVGWHLMGLQVGRMLQAELCVSQNDPVKNLLMTIASRHVGKWLSIIMSQEQEWPFIRITEKGRMQS